MKTDNSTSIGATPGKISVMENLGRVKLEKLKAEELKVEAKIPTVDEKKYDLILSAQKSELLNLTPAERAKLRRMATPPASDDSGAWKFHCTHMNAHGTVNDANKDSSRKRNRPVRKNSSTASPRSTNQKKVIRNLPVGTVLAVEFNKNCFTECQIKKHSD